jgi:hypothetical protein
VYAERVDRGRSKKLMGKYYFQTPSPNLDAIAKRLVVWFKQHEYEVDSTKDDQCYLVQAKKTGSLRTLTGTNIAFKITLSPSDTPDEFICDMSTGKWTANIAGAGMTALFTGGVTLLTGAMGAAWTFKVERDIVDFMESTLKFKKIRTEGEPTDTAAGTPSDAPRPSTPPPLPSATLSPAELATARVKSEIAKLDDAQRAGILTAEELEVKKREVSAKAGDYEIAILVEQRTVKLKEALSAGILSQAEYDGKVSQLAETIRRDVQQQRQEAQRAEQLAKLTSALEAGILSDDEFKMKAAALG